MSVEVGKIYNGKVSGLKNFGAFVKLESGESGMVHISEIADAYVKEIGDFLAEGQDVKVRVLNIDEQGRINLSIKRAVEVHAAEAPAEPQKRETSFEDMLSKFKQESEEKFAGNKNFKDSRKSGYDRRWQK